MNFKAIKRALKSDAFWLGWDSVFDPGLLLRQEAPDFIAAYERERAQRPPVKTLDDIWRETHDLLRDATKQALGGEA
jgi:hypothetical protein